ncbi:MAG: thioredoxin family protein [Candidatus Woesearchaeota archaeon]
MALLQSEKNAMEKGSVCPEFALPNIDGTTVSSKDFLGKPFAVIFMCNHCPYVIPKMEEIADLQKDFTIIGISANNATEYPADSFENMKQLGEEKGFTYYLYDETQDVAKTFGAVCTPDVFVFDAKGELAYHGRINDAMNLDDTPTEHTLKLVLETLSKGESIEDWFKPSHGCSIKWK